MFMDKILDKLKKEQEMDAREFKNALRYLRLDDNDIKEIIKDLKLKGMIEIQKQGKDGLRIRIKNLR